MSKFNFGSFFSTMLLSLGAHYVEGQIGGSNPNSLGNQIAVPIINNLAASVGTSVATGTPIDWKATAQPIVDVAVQEATIALTNEINSVIDRAQNIPPDVKNEIKQLIEGPISALRIKL